jgi:serine protease Do
MLARQPPAESPSPGATLPGVRFKETVDGLKLEDVVTGSASDRAGLKTGDVIVGVDGHEIRDRASLMPLLATHKAGDELSFRIRRNGKYLDVTVTLARR